MSLCFSFFFFLILGQAGQEFRKKTCTTLDGVLGGAVAPAMLPRLDKRSLGFSRRL